MYSVILPPEPMALTMSSVLTNDNCKKIQFKRQCKDQTCKTAEIILLCHKVLCLFHTEPFICELIVKRHSVSCHYKCDYYKH